MHPRFLATLAIIVLTKYVNAQSLIEVRASADQCLDSPRPVPISDIVSLIGAPTDTLDGFQISISGDYDQTLDSITFQNQGNIEGFFDKANGVMELRGKAQLEEYTTALQNTFLITTTVNKIKRISITCSLSNLEFFPDNGHFYEFIPEQGITWSAALDQAKARQLYGLNGYLATITSLNENLFILDRVSGSAWIGATDQAKEGDWRWVTGPEGQEGAEGRPLDRGFTNWDVGEPNNLGDEDFAHMMDWSSPPGRWNDLPLAGSGGQYAATG